MPKVNHEALHRAVMDVTSTIEIDHAKNSKTAIELIIERGVHGFTSINDIGSLYGIDLIHIPDLPDYDVVIVDGEGYNLAAFKIGIGGPRVLFGDGNPHTITHGAVLFYELSPYASLVLSQEPLPFDELEETE